MHCESKPQGGLPAERDYAHVVCILAFAVLFARSAVFLFCFVLIMKEFSISVHLVLSEVNFPTEKSKKKTKNPKPNVIREMELST